MHTATEKNTIRSEIFGHLNVIVDLFIPKPRALICSHEALAALGLSSPFGLHDTAEKSFHNYFDGYCSCDMIGDHSIFLFTKKTNNIIVEV